MTGKIGAVRSMAWIWLFSSTARTSALVGGLRYKPTMSRTLSTNSGSVDSFQVCTRCGLSPNARQIRETADCDIPVAAAIDRVDQCVSRPDVSSRVLVIIRSICSSLMTRGRPGRGSSDNPSNRCTTNRDRHFDTVARDTPSWLATSPTVPHRTTPQDQALDLAPPKPTQ